MKDGGEPGNVEPPENLTRRCGGAEEERKAMKGGNGANETSVVTLRRAGARRAARKTSRGDAEARRKSAK